MITVLPSAGATRTRIATLLTMTKSRPLWLTTAIDGLVSTWGLSPFTSSTFGFYSNFAADGDVSITSGTTALTSPNGPWSATNQGMTIDVAGAGPSGAVLTTTIATYVSPTQVTLAAAASTTVAATAISAGGLAAWGTISAQSVPAAPITSADGLTQFEPQNSGPVDLSTGLVTSTGSSTPRPIATRFAEVVNVRDFGVLGDGVADDRAAIVAAATVAGATGEIFFPVGNYRIATSVTIGCAVRFAFGAKITVPTTVTVTISKGITSGLQQIFVLSGTGLVVLSNAFVGVGYPEWWGAVSGGPDCLAALNSALVALPVTQLQAADYFVSGTVLHATPNHTLLGMGSTYDSVYGTSATRVLVTNGSSHCIQVGPSTQPGGSPPAQWPLGIKIMGISFARSVAPVVASGCDAVRVSYTLHAYFEDVRGDESMNGWEFVATVSNRLLNCNAKRTTAGTGGTDSWKGFYVNGNAPLFAGGNASLYILYSHADDTRATVTNGTGFYLDGAFTDCFLSWCETVTCTVGIQVVGTSAAGLTFSNTDCQIQNCINDAFKVYGTYILNLAQAGSVEVLGGYEGPALGATAARFVSASQASVVMTGGQLIMGVAPGCLGVYVDTCSGVRVDGTQILEAGTTAVALVSATNCDIQPIIKNRSTSGGAGVQLSGTPLANYIKPTILGKASGVTIGVQIVGTADARNEYNCTGIDSSTVAGGSANKLTRNGVQITATGLSGTNLVSGVMT